MIKQIGAAILGCPFFNLMSLTIDSIYKKYWTYFFVIAREIVKDRDVAQDITQDAMIRLSQKKEEDFRDINAVRKYLLKAVKTQCYRYVEHMGIRQRHKNYVLALSSEGEDVSLEEIEKTVLIKRIFELYPDLPPQMQQLFKLVYANGMNIKQASEKLGVSWSTGRVMHRNIVSFFRKKIKAAR